MVDVSFYVKCLALTGGNYGVDKILEKTVTPVSITHLEVDLTYNSRGLLRAYVKRWHTVQLVPSSNPAMAKSSKP